jgi:hypothetical protein
MPPMAVKALIEEVHLAPTMLLAMQEELVALLGRKV